MTSPALILNTDTASARRCACSCSEPAAAAASSTSAAFCCVTSSICDTARFTWSIPPDCSSEAADISPMMSVTRLTDATISCIVPPARSTARQPLPPLLTQSPPQHRARRRGRLFHQRRVLLRHLVHLRHRAVHLVDPARLLFRGRRYLAHDVRHPLDRRHDLLHRRTRPLHLLRARAHLAHRVLDQHLDLFGRLRAALRQRTDLARHHRKALALLARPRRFHRRVQRQNVRLERDPVDHRQIGRASCRERVCQYVYISVVAVSLKKKKENSQINTS